MLSNADLITVETYVQQLVNKGKQFENRIFIYGPKCTCEIRKQSYKKNYV